MSSPSHCNKHAVSRRFRVLRRSPHPSFDINFRLLSLSRHSERSEESRSLVSWILRFTQDDETFSFSHFPSDSIAPSDFLFHSLSAFGKMIFGYRSWILWVFLRKNSSTSSGFIGSRIYVRQRERRALITVKLGFSVVAPMRVTIHFSTQGRRTSCWLLVQRWISSRNRMVCLPSLKFLCAFAIIFTTSSFFERTPERWKNSASREFAITRASEVFPHPGGHQRRIEGILPASINFRIGFPTQMRCDCPTRSSSFSGRRREASGVMEREKRDCIVAF